MKSLKLVDLSTTKGPLTADYNTWGRPGSIYHVITATVDSHFRHNNDVDDRRHRRKAQCDFRRWRWPPWWWWWQFLFSWWGVSTGPSASCIQCIENLVLAVVYCGCAVACAGTIVRRDNWHSGRTVVCTVVCPSSTCTWRKTTTKYDKLDIFLN